MGRVESCTNECVNNNAPGMIICWSLSCYSARTQCGNVLGQLADGLSSLLVKSSVSHGALTRGLICNHAQDARQAHHDRYVGIGLVRTPARVGKVQAGKLSISV